MRTEWTDEKVASRIQKILDATGKFPTSSYLREYHQNDLMCQISKRGGFEFWATKMGVSRAPSDSDTGWDGEKLLVVILGNRGFRCKRQDSVTWPFDILVDDVLRVDVKSANYAEYGHSTGWFFRIGKKPQADVIALLKMDTKDVYFVPWYHCTETNITITKTGKRYSAFLNNFELLGRMSKIRKREMDETNLKVYSE